MIKTTSILIEQVDFHLDVSSYSFNLCVSECKYSVYSRYTLRKWNLHKWKCNQRSYQVINRNRSMDNFFRNLTRDNRQLADLMCQNMLNETTAR